MQFEGEVRIGRYAGGESISRIDEIYKQLVRIYAYDYLDKPLFRLGLDIKALQTDGKSRERAVVELALKRGLKIVEINKMMNEGKSEEEAIKEFLKGMKLHLTEDDTITKSIVVDVSREIFREKLYNPSKLRTTKGGPTKLWYLVPLFFGIFGGIIGYVAVKDEDIEMAKNILFFGCIIFFVNLLFLWLYWSWIFSQF